MTSWPILMRGLISQIPNAKRFSPVRASRRQTKRLTEAAVIEALELRVLPVSSLGIAATTGLTLLGGNLFITDTSSVGQNDELTISSDTTNNQYVIFDPHHDLSVWGIGDAFVSSDLHTAKVPFSDVTGWIQINTLGGDDSLTLDFSLGNFERPINYHGGSQISTSGDSLTLTGGSFATGRLTFTDASTGTIDLAGNAPISYTELEPVDTTGTTIDDLVFSYAGGAETIALTDAGGANLWIKSTLGESVIFANPVNSLTIDAGSGDDTINISSVNAAYHAALMINGDAGSDVVNLDAGITFAPDRNLDVDLQNDTFDPGIDAIFVGPDAQLLLSGTGAGTLRASGNITLARGSSVITVDGDLTIEANQQAAPTVGNFIGVDINQALVQSNGTGLVTVIGKGGDDTGGFQYGVNVTAGGVIAGGTTGLLTVLGTGGSADGYFNVGVYLSDPGSSITSKGSDVSVIGTGAGAADFNFNEGVALYAGARITAGGMGAVQVVGSGSETIGAFSSNYGVYVTDAGSAITSGGGSVSVTGTGGGTVGGTADYSSNYGIAIQAGAQIAAGSSGATSVQGTGSPLAGQYSSNYGVYVAGAGSIITGGGPVLVEGEAAGAGEGSSNYGVAVQTGASITARASGSVTVTASGGGMSDYGTSNFGVYVTDADSIITSSGGNVSVTGTGGGAGDGSSNYGVAVQSAGKISAGVDGIVTVFGVGGILAGSASTNFGVYVSHADITSSGGDVSVSGTGGGNGDSSSNYGVAVQRTAHIMAAGTGAVTVVGFGGHTTEAYSSNFGVLVWASSIESSSGPVSVTGTGGATGDNSFNYGVLVESNSQITAGAAGDVSVVGTGGDTTDSGSTNYGILLTDANALISSSGGDVSISGSAGGSVASLNYGVAVQAAGQIQAGNLGAVSVVGTGGNVTVPGADNFGVFVTDPNSLITSSGGDVSVTGIEGGGSAGIAIVVSSSGAITTAANGGDVTLNANSMRLVDLATISASATDSVIIRQLTGNVPINLGSAADIANGPLSLSDAELDRVTAGTIVIGDTQSGAITVTAEITHLANGNVHLVGGSDIVIRGGQFNTGGGTLLLTPGTAPAAVKPVFSGIDVTVSQLSLAGNLALEIDGTIPNTTFTQLAVAGTVNLTGANLALSGAYIPSAADNFVIINNDGSDAVSGTFNGLPEHSVVTIHGVDKLLTYVGGDGNDVELLSLGSPPISLSAPDVVYNGSPYDAAVASLKDVYGTPNSSLEGVGLVFTYYLGNHATGTPIPTPINVDTYTVVATFAGSASYLGSSSIAETFHIVKANATIVVTPYGTTYDATAHTATGTVRGVLNENLSGLVLTGTTHTNAGNYVSDPWTFTDTTGNYNDANGSAIDTIAKANATIVVTPYSTTYDAAAHSATGTVKGVINENLAGLILTGTSHTNAGNYVSDIWTFIDTTGNYNNATGTVVDKIAKANATIVVTAYNVLYDGAAHTATGSAKGVLNESLSGLVLIGTRHTTAGTYAADAWSFADTTGNYNDASGTIIDRILKPSSLSGYVYVDANNNGLRTTETGLADVTVTLTGFDDLGASVSQVLVTNCNGFYQFTYLRPGTYVIAESQPVGYLDGKDTIGTPGGFTRNDEFSVIPLIEGVNGVENNFGEIGAVIKGMKYLDVTGNGLTDEDTALGGATFKLFRDTNGNSVLDWGDGTAVGTTVSATNGTFSFGDLPLGVYFVQEAAMAGYVRTGPTLSDYYKVNAQAGSVNGIYKFANAEVCDTNALDKASIKYYINGNCTPVYDLRGKVNPGDTVEVRFTVVDAGETFTLVSYTAPGKYFDPNTANLQSIFDTDTIINASVGVHSLKVLVPNSYFQVDFVCCAAIDHFGPAGSNIFYSQQGRLYGADNDGSQAYATSTLSGYVYRDNNNNGVKDSGESGIGNVTIKLTGTDILGHAVTMIVTTNSSGYYVFGNLKASDQAGYKITEIQPVGYTDGKETIGTLGGTVSRDSLTTRQLNSNQMGLNYNFGERP